MLSRGRLVYVEGRLRTRTWEDETGEHYSTEVVAEAWQVLDSKRAMAAAAADAASGEDEVSEGEPIEQPIVA